MRTVVEWCLFGWSGWACQEASTWAGWASAVGTFVAIAGAFYLGRHQQQAAQRLEAYRARLERVRRVRGILGIVRFPLRHASILSGHAFRAIDAAQKAGLAVTDSTLDDFFVTPDLDTDLARASQAMASLPMHEYGLAATDLESLRGQVARLRPAVDAVREAWRARRDAEPARKALASLVGDIEQTLVSVAAAVGIPKHEMWSEP